MYTDKLEVHILELPKLSKFEYSKTELLEWARFFAAEKKGEFEVLANENAYIKKAYDRLTTISADEQKRLEYEAREKAIRDYNWQMKSNWNAGHNAGVKQGIGIGISQGRVSLVCKKLLKGQSVEQIADALEETVESIAKICEVANKFAPDYDVEKICKALQQKEL